MKNLMRTASVLLMTAWLGACATIVRGTREEVSINSSPPGAEATTSSGAHCDATPCAVKVPRKHVLTVTLSKPGYKTTSAQMVPEYHFNGGMYMAGNLLVGGILGMTVDAVSGATKDLTPNPFYVTLEPEQTAARDTAPPPFADAPPPLAASAPAPPMDGATWTSSRQAQYDRAYVLGQSQALRQVCVDGDDQYWRNQFSRMIDEDGAASDFAGQLVGSYKAGYQATRAAYLSCDDHTLDEQARLSMRRRSLGLD